MPTTTPLHRWHTAANAVFIEEDDWTIPARYREFHEEYENAVKHAALIDQSHRTKIVISGKDARSFLHNLSTNDIAGLAIGGGCESFLASAKAKFVAQLFVFRTQEIPDGDAVWLDAGACARQKIIAHLNRYIISEQVEIVDKTTEFAQFHLVGPNAVAIVSRCMPTVPNELPVMHRASAAFLDGAHVDVRRRDSLCFPGFDFLCPNEAAEHLWEKLLLCGATAAGRDVYETLRIEAGLPLEGIDMTADNLVMELGRTASAICYTKGCFLGQEPIVRARDIGHVNWKLTGIRFSDATPVTCGNRLVNDGKEIGRITSTTVSPRLRKTIALAFIRRGFDQPGTQLRVANGSESLIGEVVQLPFVPQSN